MTPPHPLPAFLPRPEDLPDVIDILGVSFERWRKNDADGPASPSATGGAANGSKVDGDKMVLLYLPGIEGLGTSVEPQLPALSEKFDVFRLIIGAEDRSTFSTLSRAVSLFVVFLAGTKCLFGIDCEEVESKMLKFALNMRLSSPPAAYTRLLIVVVLSMCRRSAFVPRTFLVLVRSVLKK